MVLRRLLQNAAADSGIAQALNHVCGALAAREGDKQLRLAIIEHLLIADWASSLAVLGPISAVDALRNSAL